MPLFLKILSIAAILYGGFGAITGKVYSTRETTTYLRHSQPFAFWATCLSYVAVGTLIFAAVTYRYG